MGNESDTDEYKPFTRSDIDGSPVSVSSGFAGKKFNDL